MRQSTKKHTGHRLFQIKTLEEHMMRFWRNLTRKTVKCLYETGQKHSHLHSHTTTAYGNSPIIRGRLQVYTRAPGPIHTTTSIPFEGIIPGGLRPNQWYTVQYNPELVLQLAFIIDEEESTPTNPFRRN